jgi:hypothetical protein
MLHAPVLSQVCTAPLEHRVVPGAQLPWQPPLTQALAPQCAGEPHVRDGLQV